MSSDSLKKKGASSPNRLDEVLVPPRTKTKKNLDPSSKKTRNKEKKKYSSNDDIIEDNNDYDPALEYDKSRLDRLEAENNV